MGIRDHGILRGGVFLFLSASAQLNNDGDRLRSLVPWWPLLNFKVWSEAMRPSLGGTCLGRSTGDQWREVGGTRQHGRGGCHGKGGIKKKHIIFFDVFFWGEKLLKIECVCV